MAHIIKTDTQAKTVSIDCMPHMGHEDLSVIINIGNAVSLYLTDIEARALITDIQYCIDYKDCKEKGIL